MDSLLESLFSLLGPREEKYEPTAPLSKEEATEWDNLQNEIGRVKSLAQEIEAKKRLFWASIEKKLNIYDRDLRIQNGMVLEKVIEKKYCETPGKTTVGFLRRRLCELCHQSNRR